MEACVTKRQVTTHSTAVRTGILGLKGSAKRCMARCAAVGMPRTA